jgi:hypothetical protein
MLIYIMVTKNKVKEELEMAQVHKDGSIVAHPFEASGLGKAPFRFVGVFEKAIQYPDGTSQASGTCQHCGNGIRYCFEIEASDGKHSIVGSSCINKTDTTRLVAIVESEVRKLRNEKARARREAKRKAERQEIQERIDEYKEALEFLAQFPHPYHRTYDFAKDLTLADYYTYIYGNTPDNMKNFNEVLCQAKGKGK